MRKLLIGFFVMLTLAGCQAQPEPQDTTPLTEDRLPTPSIQGPEGPPSVKGPTSPPPGSGSPEPQAMTEVEKVEYTLPKSTEAEFKY